jgi:Concanavalin A-like lectin/glucanases superfamily
MSSSYPSLVIADGAVAYWRLGETSGTTANDSIGTAHGTISGGVTLNQPGALADGDQAMAFNGVDGHVESPAVLLPVTCAVECWLKSTDTTGALVSHRGASGPDFTFGMYPKLYVFMPGPGFVASSGRVIADNQWHHAVAVFDGTTLWFYVDGVLDFTTAFSRPAAATQPFSLGRDPQDTGVWYLGVLDDVAIYPTILTAPQIAAHYAARTWTAAPTNDMRYRWCRFVRRPFRQVTR